MAIVISVRRNADYPRHARVRAVTRTLGLMTYPFYLIHQSVSGSVMGYLILAGSSDAAALALGLLVSLVLSWVILVLWDPAIRQAMTWVGTWIGVAIEGFSAVRRSRRMRSVANSY
jgi:peptidoglycan/LPS O-acetylase OafA/YrhL